MIKLRCSFLFSFFTASCRPERARRSHTQALSILTILFALTSTPAIAGNYELVKGKGVEVCDAYENALNAVKVVSGTGYSRPMPKDAKDFRKPEWKTDINMFEAPYLRKIWRYRFDRDTNPVISFFGVNRWREWQGTKEQYAQAWESYRSTFEKGDMQWEYLSRFDIDNDGEPETIYLDHFGRRALFVVLNKDMTDLDYDKTERAQGHPPRKAMGFGEFRLVTKENKGEWGVSVVDIDRGMTPIPDAATNASYDFFFYKGKTYYDLWWDNHPSYQGRPSWEMGRLQVFILEKGQSAREVCTYKLTPEVRR